jgi:RNA recognition motif-containing protein
MTQIAFLLVKSFGSGHIVNPDEW